MLVLPTGMWCLVAPRAGAWIEILFDVFAEVVVLVAPRAGAWIEILLTFVVVVVLGGRSPCGRNFFAY